jgi:hypothetical protein
VLVTAHLILLAGCYPFTTARAEPVIGQFELKTLDSAAGAYEFQSQNAWSWDQPQRQIQDNGADGFVADENSITRERYALELERGFNRFFKMRVGIEFEKERLDDPATIAQANDFGTLKLAEVGIEAIAILIPREDDGAGLGVVAELEGPPDQDEPNNLTLGAIVEFKSGPWLAAAVPMAVHSFGGNAEAGEQVDTKWDFAYAAQLMYTFSASWSLALEGYGTVERIDNSGHPSDSAQRFGDFDQHRAGAILYYTYDFDGAQPSVTPAAPTLRSDQTSLSDGGEDNEGTSLTVGIGLLEGLNDNTPDHTLKLSVEVHF